MPMGFVYQQLEDISLRLILGFREPLTYTGCFKDLGDFYYYKLSQVVMDIFRLTKIRSPSNRLKSSPNQLVLPIN